MHGPYEPSAGRRFNANKIVLDPYAKAIGRKTHWKDEMFGYTIGDPAQDLSFDERDNAACAPLAVVIDPAFTWGDDKAPKNPWHKTLIYELHVKGYTHQHPKVPERLRGTYAGLASAPVIRHLTDLGVTAVELMPVHHHADERHLLEKGLVNYWGYNTLSFFAPDMRYASAETPAGAVKEFKQMVRALHAAGIEVILDVVYNHTAEGNHLGPTLSWRGIDNSTYYRLADKDKRHYLDFTGCGNTLNMLHPRVLQLIMDSLRYWVLEMRVDGFRFDLASALARELYDVDKLGAFFDIIHQDPVISQVKLIAEPWDLGPGGYQVGNFPVGWAEWNGKYRDTVRRFWKGEGGVVSELATRLAGSSDLYEQSGRRPYASINFVTSHDGFTLDDLVSYNDKRNEANSENNKDGENQNFSFNHGVEGPANDPAVLALREQQKRNFFATMCLSQGVEMIRGGDELGHTQQGNNNAYCQDNEISWLNWNLDKRRRDFLEFAKKAIALWKNNPVFQRRRFFEDRPLRGSDVKDIYWLEPSGSEMTDEMWNAPEARSLGILLPGDAIDEMDESGERISGNTFLLLFNAHDQDIAFAMPSHVGVAEIHEQFWETALDTARPNDPSQLVKPTSHYRLKAKSLAVFRLLVHRGDS